MTDTPESVNLSDVSSRKVDTELLNELRDLFARAEDQKERYDFTWNGKAKAYFEAATPTTKTLRPQPEESYIYADDDYKEKVNTFNDSENLFITGDNLEALKLLQESYLGKIDMIYIDPPYNTGKDFVYHDNFKSTQKDTDVAEGSVDEDGNRLVKNEKNSGRYHSDWLSMMYPRLKLARNLLSDSGVIFVSIDDNEQANLKLLMDEVFGADNFVATLIVTSNSSKNNAQLVGVTHEYVLVYSKNLTVLLQNTNGWRVKKNSIEEYQKRASWVAKNIHSQEKAHNELLELVKYPRFYDFDHYTYVDEQGVYQLDNMGGVSNGNKATNLVHPITGKVTAKPNGGFRYQEEKLRKLVNENKIDFGENDTVIPRLKRYLLDYPTQTPKSVSFFDSQSSTKWLKSENLPFDFAKSVSFIDYLVEMGTFSNKNATILDFFAGSATTAHSIMDLNAKDGGHRKTIMVTLDESTPKNSPANKTGYQTIDQISRERIRRAAKKLGDTSGFRALKVDKTGLKADVFKTAGELTQENLQLDVDNQADARSDYDLLYDVLVDGALEYNRQIATETISNEPIIKYDYLGQLSGVIAYFGDNLTSELTREIAKLKPLIAVFKESTFNKSSDKVNVLEQFRVISPETKVKVI